MVNFFSLVKTANTTCVIGQFNMAVFILTHQNLIITGYIIILMGRIGNSSVSDCALSSEDFRFSLSLLYTAYPHFCKPLRLIFNFI